MGAEKEEEGEEPASKFNEWNEMLNGCGTES